MRLRPEIAEAISEGVKAGVFRRAARLNCHCREVWEVLAGRHSNQVKWLLHQVTQGDAGRMARRRDPR